MRFQAHHKISNVFVILFLMCIFGLPAIIQADDTLAAHSEEESTISLAEEIASADENTSNHDLDKAESKDSQKLEIIKQIRKLNNDGSYTVGYEAEDGTFKIESRDVLGNVKGTFGYVDVNGEIKRVSYTANNGTGLKNSPTAVDEVVQIPRYNRSVSSPTTRRPYSSSTTASPTRATVIQTIPRRLRILAASNNDRPIFSSTVKTPTHHNSNAKKQDPTTTIVYATSVPTPKTYVNIRPTPLPGTSNKPTAEQQLSRPEKLEIQQQSANIQISSHRDSSSTSKPVTENIDEKETDDKKPIRGNSLRRQLMQETDNHFETRQQIVYSQSVPADEAGHVYGAVGATVRPLFTTTSSPRIPSVVLAARHRAAQIQNNNNQQSTTEKYYIKAPARVKEDPEDNEPATEPSSEQTYLTQSPVPVQIPASRSLTQASEEDRRVLRRPAVDSRYRSPQFVRVHQQPHHSNHQSSISSSTTSRNSYESPQLIRIPLPQTSQQEQSGDQYLRETTPSSKIEQTAEQEQIPNRIPQGYYRNAGIPVTQAQPSQYYIYPQQEDPTGYSTPSYPIPYPRNPYREGPYNPQYYDNPERPLTTRDFERLLQLLIYRHQQLQRVSYVTGGPQYQGFSPYGFNPYPQYQRQIVYNPFDGRPSYRPSINPYQDQENMYQAQNPIPTTDTSMSYELQRIMPRKKQQFGSPSYYTPQRGQYPIDEYGPTPVPVPGSAASFLPPDVREELLYRMLMLALQSEQQSTVLAPGATTMPNDSDASTTTKTPIIYKKPVRSVQILGEE